MLFFRGHPTRCVAYKIPNSKFITPFYIFQFVHLVSMKTAISNKIYTLEEYIQLDEAGEIRHEFINGNLYEMSGANRVHNKMATRILLFLTNLLETKGFEVFRESMKLKIQGENKYFYPDVFITKEPQTDANLYFQEYPELIIEVSSPSTRIYDAVEKFLQYRKIDSLLYYILVEQDKVLVTLYSRLNAAGEWQSEVFISADDVIDLKTLQISLPVKTIYNLP